MNIFEVKASGAKAEYKKDWDGIELKILCPKCNSLHTELIAKNENKKMMVCHEPKCKAFFEIDEIKVVFKNIGEGWKMCYQEKEIKK